jgi:hypothetical protein
VTELTSDSNFEISGQTQDLRYRARGRGIHSSQYLVNSITGFEINVIGTDWNPFECVLTFHSTPVMNALTDQGITCAYLDMTVRGFGLINSTMNKDQANRFDSPHLDGIITKYANRGIILVHTLRDERIWIPWKEARVHTCGNWVNCPYTVRDTADEGTTFIKFDDRVPISSDATTLYWTLATSCPCKDASLVKPGLVLSSDNIDDEESVRGKATSFRK